MFPIFCSLLAVLWLEADPRQVFRLTRRAHVIPLLFYIVVRHNTSVQLARLRLGFLMEQSIAYARKLERAAVQQENFRHWLTNLLDVAEIVRGINLVVSFK
jgi:hypothetical protein